MSNTDYGFIMMAIIISPLLSKEGRVLFGAMYFTFAVVSFFLEGK